MAAALFKRYFRFVCGFNHVFTQHYLVSKPIFTTSLRNENKSSKSDKTVVKAIIRQNWENKLLFGELVEKVSKRTSRTKNEVDDQKSEATQEKKSSQRKTKGQKNVEPASEETNGSSNSEDKNNKVQKSNNRKVKKLSKTTARFLENFPLYVQGEDTDLEKFKKELSRTEHVDHCPSVTKILESTMSPESKEALEKWKRDLINKLGFDGFLKYQQEMFSTGTKVHSLVEDYFLGSLPELSELDPKVKGFWESVSPALSKFSETKIAETVVKHPFLQYVGKVDCLAKYRNTLVLVEWKTAQKPKPLLKHTYDAPVQLAAYIGALSSDLINPHEIHGAVVVVCYESGLQAHTHYISSTQIMGYWRDWTNRLTQYWEQQFKKQIKR